MIPLPRALTTLALAGLSVLASPGRADPDSHSGGLLLVANKQSRTLSLVDPLSESEVASVAEGGITGHEVAATADGLRAFVPIYGDSGVGKPGTDGSLIRVIDLKTREISGTIDLGRPTRPHRPVFGPRDGLLYVTTELSDSVTIIDPATLRVVGSVPTGQAQSHMLAISSDGRFGYTANVNTGTVSVLDLGARTLAATIKVSPFVQRIALSVDDRYAFTADQTAARLAVIDTASRSVVRSIPLPGLAYGTAPTPDGRSLVVAIPGLSLVAEVDLGTMRVARTLGVPQAPQEVLVRPDGAVAYVSCDSSGKVAAIDLANWRVEKLITVGPMDDGLAWAPAR